MPKSPEAKRCGTCGENYVPSDESGIHVNCGLSVATFSAEPPTAHVIGDSDKTIVAPTDPNRTPSSQINTPASDIARSPSSSSGPGGTLKRRMDPQLPP